MKPLPIINNPSGRGSVINTQNRFSLYSYYDEKDIRGENLQERTKTKFIPVFPKSIVNKVDSPDIPFMYSLNPYQGCEHGCIYCYARNSHNYWGYSAGIDFEAKILIKQNLGQLLVDTFSKKSWVPLPISLSGNTDCYQPIEKKTKSTRILLELFLKYKHPVSIITKNALILRDLDIISELAKHNLISVAFSINTVDDRFRQKLEPRTASISKRWNAAKKLREHGVPVSILAAPIIPGLNDHEAFKMVAKAKEVDAFDIFPLVVRLNGDLEVLFSDWLHTHFPDRKEKVLNKIKSLHGGKVQNNTFGQRMRGSGLIADIIHQQFRVAKQKIGFHSRRFYHDCTLFVPPGGKQLSLF